MKDRSYLFQRRMLEKRAQPIEDDCAMPQDCTATGINEMTSCTSSSVYSHVSISKHTVCGEPTPTTASETNTASNHHLLWEPLSMNTDDNTRFDQSGYYAPSSPCPRGLYTQNGTTRLKSAFCILSYPSIMSFLHTKPSTIAILLCLLMTFLVSPSTAFNLDLKTAVIHEGKNGSMFGYSVAQHVDQSTHWLLIGAPRAQTRQTDVVRGGAVYRCKTDRVNSCQQVPFDTKGNNIRYEQNSKEYLPIEEKSNQWFGATIESSGESGVIVACAPRYIYFGIDHNKREPVGMCWVAKTSTTEYESYSPCAKGQGGFEHQGFCQAGLSATLSYDGRRLMIAAPGSWYWQGQLYNFKTDERGRVFAKTPEGNASQDNTYRGQMFVYDAVSGKPRFTNKEGRSDTDYGYRGYSSAIGKFDGDKEDDYVVGIPKGDDYVGMVEIYTQNLTLLGSISGEQIGSYFGGAVTVVDLNGDSLDDIIVGAPLFTNFKHSKSWDTGRVYIYYQTMSHVFKASKRDILDGVTSRSRFGMALSGLGDIDFNGYHDLCVGAPYGGEDNKGAIYIFHGSKDGIITEVSQIIYASDFKSPLSAFGSSISAGIDQDGNSYPDVLVGAHDSNKAVFMRTRPIVKVTANLKLNPEAVDLDKTDCVLFDGTKVICLNVHTCFNYEGTGLPSELYFDLEWHLDAKEGNHSNAERRAFFLTSHQSVEKKTIRIKRENSDCTTSQAYIRPDAIDRLSSIRTILKFNLNFKEEETVSRRKRDLQPILNSYTRTHTSFTVEILKNCGEDKVCHPDLYVTYISVDTKYVFGDSKDLEVLIIVGNNGEDAFNSKLFVEMPPGVDYSGITGQRSEFTITCDPPEDGSQVVVCNLGNPMTNGTTSEFTFKVKPTNSNDTQAVLKFALHVNSSNPELAGVYGNNQVNYEIPVTVDAQIKLFGTANPEQFNATEQGVEDGIGKLVRHVFVLKSNGLSPINETELLIRWPNRDSRGRNLLTLDGPLKTEGNGKCSIAIITPANASRVKDNNIDNYPLFNTISKDEQTRNIRCVYHYCTFIRCWLGYMNPDSKFIVTVYSRLKVKSFLEGRREIDDEEDVDTFNLVSSAHAKVLAVPFNFTISEAFPTEGLELITTLSTVDDENAGSQKVAIWIYAVAISVGILLLLLIILLLWCCGFFKRKKHEDDNGYFAVNGKNDIDNKYVD